MGHRENFSAAIRLSLGNRRVPTTREDPTPPYSPLEVRLTALIPKAAEEDTCAHRVLISPPAPGLVRAS